jgi:hypothetical protein
LIECISTSRNGVQQAIVADRIVSPSRIRHRGKGGPLGLEVHGRPKHEQYQDDFEDVDFHFLRRLIDLQDSEQWTIDGEEWGDVGCLVFVVCFPPAIQLLSSFSNILHSGTLESKNKWNMKTFTWVLALFFVLGAPCLMGQAEGNYKYSSNPAPKNNLYYDNVGGALSSGPTSNAVITGNNEVVVKVNGLMNVLADNYVAVFNVLQVGDKIESTNEMMNTRLAVFKGALRQAGIDTADIHVDMISFVPRFDIEVETKVFTKNNNEVPAGFELQKNVMVRYRKSTQLDAVIGAAARAEIYDLVKVDYFIPSLQKSYDTLQLACLNEVKSRVKNFELIGFKLDTLRKVMAEDFYSTFPGERYSSYKAFARTSLPAARRNGSPAKLNEADKTTSRFYGPIEYNRYDLVINPVVIEPMVQLSYSVTVKYLINEPVQPKALYYIIMENGELRQVSVK